VILGCRHDGDTMGTMHGVTIDASTWNQILPVFAKAERSSESPQVLRGGSGDLFQLTRTTHKIG
jgi:hypothetical protein